MTFPKPWLEDENAPNSVRDVLRSQGMDPPDGAENAVWSALLVQIGAAGAAGGGAGAAAAGGGASGASGATGAATGGATLGTTGGAAVASGGLLKAILIGAVSGIVAVSGYSALAPSDPSPRPAVASNAASEAPPNSGAAPISEAAKPAVSALQSAAPSAAPVAPVTSAHSVSNGAPEPTPTAVSTVDVQAPLPGSPEERESRLREESEMLQQARAALRGGDTGGAMRLLEQSRQKFQGGMLGQEREALTIETLAKSGAKEAASSRAAAFIKAHPQSPHAARLQVYVTQ